MKRFALLLPMAFCAYFAKAQAIDPVPASDEVFEMSAIERAPEFAGGEAALFKYVSSHVKYPQAALESGIQGRVFVEFVVGKDGNVGDVRVKRGASTVLDEEAVRVVRSLPAFKPGVLGGQPVKVRYLLPIVFKLTE